MAQINSWSLLVSSVILTGEAATGKTAALSTAASALNMQTDRRSKINIHLVYPGAFDDLSILIGRFSATGAWEDGVCTSLLRKGLKVSSLASFAGCKTCVNRYFHIFPVKNNMPNYTCT